MCKHKEGLNESSAVSSCCTWRNKAQKVTSKQTVQIKNCYVATPTYFNQNNHKNQKSDLNQKNLI